MKFEFDYNFEDDVLSIYNYNLQPSETIEISEFLNVDIDKDGHIVGIEIIGASEFFSMFNKEINKNLLDNLKDVSLEEKEYRNNWFISVILKSENKVFVQNLPPMSKSEYASPLIANS